MKALWRGKTIQNHEHNPSLQYLLLCHLAWQSFIKPEGQCGYFQKAFPLVISLATAKE
jgi:hypothetical protein